MDRADRQRKADTDFISYRVDDSASLRASAGVTVFWDSPFGPVRFDLSQIQEQHGLALLRDRLRLQFGDRATLKVEVDSGHTRVTVVISG